MADKLDRVLEQNARILAALETIERALGLHLRQPQDSVVCNGEVLPATHKCPLCCAP